MDASPQSAIQRDWMRWLPGLQTLRAYDPAWLVHDLGAGLVLTTVLAPVGIAYAVASGLPGVYGLYATIVPLLAYAVFGPSRILVLGRRPLRRSICGPSPMSRLSDRFRAAFRPCRFRRSASRI